MVAVFKWTIGGSLAANVTVSYCSSWLEKQFLSHSCGNSSDSCSGKFDAAGAREKKKAN
jgi:hypothetical protein